MNTDNFPLIEFAGYANTATLTPQYKFTPLKGHHIPFNPAHCRETVPDG